MNSDSNLNAHGAVERAATPVVPVPAVPNCRLCTGELVSQGHRSFSTKHVAPILSHVPLPPPIDLTPVDAYRLHLHLLEHYRLTGEAVLPMSVLRKWPAAIGISRKRFDAAVHTLAMFQHVRIEMLGKVMSLHLSVAPPVFRTTTL